MARFQSERPTSTSSSVASNNSGRPMLGGSEASNMALNPPTPRFARGGPVPCHESLSSRNSVVSLGHHYLPSKLPSNISVRRRSNIHSPPTIPKRGAGVSAFRSGEARVAVEKDEDYDGLSGSPFSGEKLRWNRFKWTLVVANSFLTLYSMTALVFCLLTHLNAWQRADIVRVGNTPELIVSTVAAAFGLLTSLVGWSGIMLNNRGFLAVYTFFLWLSFGLLVIPGYVTYRRRTFNLEGKVNHQWSRDIGTTGRSRIQNQLGCCGYFSPFVEATVTQTCYARSILPGCKKPFLDFQRMVLDRWYTVAFALVPLHLAITIAGLLCSNHVTYRFGKGMTPKAYRLNPTSMALIIDSYANDLADQYGRRVATEVVARTSRSNSPLNLESMPIVSHANGRLVPPSAYRDRSSYDQVGAKAPEGAM